MTRKSHKQYTTFSYGRRYNRASPHYAGQQDTSYTQTNLSAMLNRTDSHGTKRINGRWFLPTAYTTSFWQESYVAFERRNQFWTDYSSAPVLVSTSDLVGWIHVDSLSNLKNKAIGNMSDTEVSGGVFVGEARESFEMIAVRAKQVLGALKAARRLDFRGVARSLGVEPLPKGKSRNGLTRTQQANNLFLEYKFGWLPMLSDVYDACKAINNIESGSRVVQTNVATDRASDRKRLTGATPYSFLMKEGRAERRVSMTFERINTKKSLASTFGIDDPLSIAWDLTAMSFVYNWFLPIGDFLGALHQFGKVRFLHGYMSDWESSVIKPGDVKPGYTIVGKPKPSRVIWTDRNPINDGTADIPTFRLPKSAGQAMTAVNLIVQRI
uniref:Uncharacterized protein n=1 Tax=Beihai levi-like virus 18 TaxID=1922403 RepID=A0A1L3KIC6_9VIRU|nr:hypothetical protein [Beihai levi-like virus 18]